MSVWPRMADRLQELLQQRALIREHLEWLDAEIAASSGRGMGGVGAVSESSLGRVAPAEIPAAVSRKPVLPTIAATPTTIATATSLPAVPRAPDDADALLAKLAAEEKTAPIPTKSGCWILFSAVLGLLVLGTTLLLHYFYRG